MTARLPKVGLASVALFLALDQWVKWLVFGPLAVGQRPDCYEHKTLIGPCIELAPVFRLTSVQNYGVSLGWLQLPPDRAWVLIALTGAIALAVLVWMWREAHRWDQVALGMIAGGALGNILDRIRLGHVQDYANLHFGTWEPFLNFNLADAAITVGVLVLLARALVTRDTKTTGRADVEISDA